MAKINFKDKNLVMEVEENTTLLQCIRKAGLRIETPCNAIGLCGKCKVIAKGELSLISEEEKKFINEEKNERLACIAKVKGNVEIELIKENSELKTINKGFSIDVKPDGDIFKIALPDVENSNSKPYAETLNYKVKAFHIYEKIGLMESENKKHKYAVVYKDEIIDICEENKNILGVAIDIGTTGISSYLVDLETGEIIDKISSLNPQTEFGGDVLTRITYCMNNINGAEELKISIINEINRIIKELTGEKFAFNQIYEVVISGNTTMLHLLLGVNPISLAKAPYRPVFLDALHINGKDIGVDFNREGIFTLLPSASAYVGADIVSGVVASDFQNKKWSSIFVDIGTNGEIVAINEGKIMATSTAAGPALEGMNISCGCRAQKGAIESFSIDDDFNINYNTIGSVDPVGICGSGLIDIAAVLVEKGIVLKSGKFNKNINEKLKDRLVDKKFYITDKVYISQKDIRQIQLAKGAIAAGIIMLLHHMGTNINEIEETVIAGAFGYHVNPDSIKQIGLIPKGFEGKITFVGNTSLEGARIALVNKDYLNLMSDLRKHMEVLELSTSDEFQKYFIEQLNF